ncbi:VOC family protein [Corynebacterium sp. A21]|uniref:VOC family protein n=1 Tax=Corynebacterium sp. A21 TaxID=3457318 RepID=UPI003FD5E567
MQADLTPYRQFPGTTKEAMEFYRSVFGGELQVMPYSAVHSPEEVGGMADKIMHAELIVDGKKLLFASDAIPGMERIKGEDTPLSLTGGPETEEELRGTWEKLAEGGEVTMPLEAVPWGAVYGALTDRFGTLWMFNIGG